jgi:diamine N-acetyltransferase
MTALTIREAGLADIAVIRELAFAIWPEVYATILSQEQLDYMLELIYSEASITRQMQEEGHHYLLMEDNGTACGFADYGATGKAGEYKLHKLYVQVREQGRGLGKQLLEAVEVRVKARGGTQLILNVNRNNRAKSFYERMNFTILETVDIAIGQGYFMNDYIMGKAMQQ